MKQTAKDLTLDTLVEAIRHIHIELSIQASRSINTSLTLRNWLIGCYIAEYELSGADRAEYGEKILSTLAKKLKDLSNCQRRQLYDYLRFYRTYPQIVRTLSAQLEALLPKPATALSQKMPTASAQSSIPSDTLISSLSFSMFKLLIELDNPTKRAFYEIECIRGRWSVRELKRQMNSLYFERSGLSMDKKKLSKLVNSASERSTLELTIRDPYIFEFLGLKSQDVMSESHLEDELISRLEEFLLELGHGFCFEARQKRILIGDEDFFIDLVFYHRILKCHVLVELKLDKFRHENLGQLNTYVNWYLKNVMTENDNPPVGILLCTDKNQALAEYALAGLDNQLFISKYQLQLPSKEEMERFIEQQIKEPGR